MCMKAFGPIYMFSEQCSMSIYVIARRTSQARPASWLQQTPDAMVFALGE
jgi:hypothetical protein